MFSDFATPQWLLAGAATVVALALAMVYADRRRRRALRAFASATPISTVSPARRWLRNALALVGVAMAFIALARPRGGYTLEHTPRQGLDLVFAVDTSKSMRAADLAPDRLTRAKLAVTDLVRKFQGERVGLIAFAGGAFVQAPMTADHNVFLEALQSLDTDVIPRPGTDISSAIRAARQAMASEPANRKLLILVSDGESLTGDALAAAREAAKEGIRIFTVGVGTARGELIETLSPDGTSRELVRDEQGNPVRSKLDETTLRSIAQVTGGQYEPLGADGRGLDRLYERSLSTLPKAAGTTTRKVYKERYQFPLAIALACLLLELLIRDRKNPRSRWSSRRARVAAVAAVSMLAIPAVASASPGSTIETYNGGTDAYRRGDFEAAQKQFDSALHTKDVGLQEDAYYNLGNARYRLGERALKTDKPQAIAAWKTALAAYDAALALQPNDQDAKFNRDLVARKLAALEAEQQQQPGGSEDKQQSSSQGQQQGGSRGQQQGGSQGQQQSGSQGQQQSGSQGQQQSGSQGQQQSGSQGQQQSGSQGQQQSGSQGQQQSGSPGQQQDRSSSNGSSPGQHPDGSSNGQRQDGSSNGQQSKSDSSGQQSNGKRNDQQANGQPNNQHANGQPNNQQANGQPNNQQANGQPDTTSGSAADHRSSTDAERQAQAARVHAPDVAAPNGNTTSAATAGDGTDGAPTTTAAERAADNARRAAGQLTRREALQLLDAAEHELKPMPIDGKARAADHGSTTTRDW